MKPDKKKLFKFYLSFFLLCLVLSCNKQSKQLSKESFDKLLLEKNEKLRLAGDYMNLVKLNQSYLTEARRKGNKEGEAFCYINIANIYSTVGNYKKGLQYAKMAENIANEKQFAPLSAKLYQEYGQLNKVLGLHDNALLYNDKALYYLKKVPVKERKDYLLGKVYANRADFMYRKERPDSSLIYFHKALKIENTPLYKALIAKHHLNYTRQNDSADVYLKRALAMFKGVQKPNAELAVVYQTSGDYYFKTGQPESALNYYQQALDMYSATNRIYQIPFVYNSIAEVYRYTGDKEKEHEYLIKYAEAKDKLNSKQNEALNLSIEKLLSDRDKEFKMSKNKIFIYVFGLLALGFVISVFIYRRNQQLLLKKYTQKKEKTESKDHVDNNVFDELVALARQNDSTFLTRFQELYPDFINKILQINPNLVNSELAFCAMVKLNFTSKEIASYTFIQHKSVQQKKHRLRKKLNVPTDQDMYVFFQNI
ncbi:tetratricopeptide repeat protein [Elizabethkingia meningoseptica]|uniref:tetratricopeptide repeat protein n=1 Tax=Elizabethkingia meningoseptica TaxID=238 RepID=UPI0022F18A47|nr:tetratricopeptide repeat protein [Elizabethkingia meningoseptica]EJK5328268.1 tetratricopeptide repeat protein [Elizabethkingia meningoseptica]MDE5437251.1 tetratricopeptide repeat protein [Elizabethkingia meningoseptica]MDE5466529.1 tetratricopeptide repeat protein [Elizabethkingia meningoseptica]MDE5474241.1 tetratricopeptide repeat protein [Elizabethkingia meningoseptica]MDE5477674.1 tetratricopeptide repeat protein [Elizabethkingia meningoseptica]